MISNDGSGVDRNSLGLAIVAMDVVVVRPAGQRAGAAGLLGRGAQRLVHDGPDRPRAAAAIRAAAQAGIDLRGRARTAWARRKTGLDVPVGQDVAGADDHGICSLEGFKRTCDISYLAFAADNAKARMSKTDCDGLPQTGRPAPGRNLTPLCGVGPGQEA